MDGVKHGFRNEQNADKCQWRAQPQTGHPGATGEDEDMTGPPSSWGSLQKTCSQGLQHPCVEGRGAVASWSLLGEGEPVFIKGLAPGK